MSHLSIKSHTNILMPGSNLIDLPVLKNLLIANLSVNTNPIPSISTQSYHLANLTTESISK